MSKPETTNQQPIDRRLSEAMAAYLLGHPTGYELPPLGIMLMQMKAALAAADAVKEAAHAD